MEYKDPSTEDMGGWFPFSIDDPNQNQCSIIANCVSSNNSALDGQQW